MPEVTNPRAIYASRPNISIDGQEQEELNSALLSLFVEETTLGLSRCEARFTNWGQTNRTTGFLFFNRTVLDFGKRFAVELGAPDVSRRVFVGHITGIEALYPPQGMPEIVVLAEDQLQNLRMERRTRSYEDVTDADVVSWVAGQHGLAVAADSDGPTYRVLAQVNQSDLAFLRERAAAIDAELWIEDNTLYMQSRSHRDAGTVPLSYGNDLLEFSVLADLAHQRTAVRVSGWDVDGKETLDQRADAAAISPELNNDSSGSEVLSQTLEEHRERITSAVPLSASEAQAMAEARYRERARRFLCGTGVAEGNPKIRVGTTLDLSGLGPLFDGEYYVTLVRHTFDQPTGYHTTFEVERPGIGG